MTQEKLIIWEMLMSAYFINCRVSLVLLHSHIALTVLVTMRKWGNSNKLPLAEIALMGDDGFSVGTEDSLNL